MTNADVDIPSGGGLRAFAVRHQMVLFVLLTYLISWSFVIPADGALIPYGPMIAAFIVLAVVASRRGVAGVWDGSGGCWHRAFLLRCTCARS